MNQNQLKVTVQTSIRKFIVRACSPRCRYGEAGRELHWKLLDSAFSLARRIKYCNSELLQLEVNMKSGQILVVTLLIMIVGLTVGLYLLSRTTTDISMTTKITDSTRAFNAAEAGVEEAIRKPLSIVPNTPIPFASGLAYTIIPGDLGVSSSIYPETKPAETKVGDRVTIWLVPHNDSTGELQISRFYYASTMTICYTSNTPTPALGVSVFYRSGGASGSMKSSYTGYDTLYNSRGNGFNQAINAPNNSTCKNNGYNYQATVSFSNTATFGVDLTTSSPLIELIALEIHPLYVAASIAVVPVSSTCPNSSGGCLPKQGNDITSIGQTENTTRRINVKDPYTQPAPFMDYAVYSFGDSAPLSHN